MLSATKELGDQTSDIAWAVEGGLKLSTTMNNFSPFIVVSGGKAFKEGTTLALNYGAGLAWKATDNIALNLKVSKVFGEDQAQAGLGLNLLF